MQQHPHFALACRKLGSDVTTLALRNGSEIEASAIVLQRRFRGVGKFNLVSRGPVWRHAPSSVHVSAAMRGLADKLSTRAGVVLASPGTATREPLHAAGYIAAQTAATSAQLDLPETDTQQLNNMHVKWRNRLTKARSAKIEVTEGPFKGDASHWLLTAEAKQRQTRGYRALPPSFTVAWSLANPDSVRIIQAHHAGSVVAAMLILLHRPGATYHIGWSSPSGRQLNAHNLLLWTAARWCADRGYKTMDLGLIDTAATPGLARFKLGSGAQSISLGETWLRAPLTPTFARVSALANLGMSF